MFIISYDFSNDRVRSRFSKFIKKYGEKIQYSVYRIKNSNRILNNILKEINLTFKKQFKDTDSIYIFRICESCNKKIYKYGSAVFEDKDVIIFD